MGQQDSAGRGDIAGESSSSSAAAAAGPSGESGLTADQQQAEPSYHLPATLDVSDGSGVSRVSPSPPKYGLSERATIADILCTAG